MQLSSHTSPLEKQQRSTFTLARINIYDVNTATKVTLPRRNAAPSKPPLSLINAS